MPDQYGNITPEESGSFINPAYATPEQQRRLAEIAKQLRDPAGQGGQMLPGINRWQGMSNLANTAVSNLLGNRSDQLSRQLLQQGQNRLIGAAGVNAPAAAVQGVSPWAGPAQAPPIGGVPPPGVPGQMPPMSQAPLPGPTQGQFPGFAFNPNSINQSQVAPTPAPGQSAQSNSAGATTYTPENLAKLSQREAGGRSMPPNQYGYEGYFQLNGKDFGLPRGAISQMPYQQQVQLHQQYLAKNGYTGKEDLGVMNAAPAFKNAPDTAIAYPAGSKEARANPQWVKYSNAGGNVTVGGIKAWMQGEQKTDNAALPTNARTAQYQAPQSGLSSNDSHTARVMSGLYVDPSVPPELKAQILSGQMPQVLETPNGEKFLFNPASGKLVPMGIKGAGASFETGPGGTYKGGVGTFEHLDQASGQGATGGLWNRKPGESFTDAMSRIGSEYEGLKTQKTKEAEQIVKGIGTAEVTGNIQKSLQSDIPDAIKYMDTNPNSTTGKAAWAAANIPGTTAHTFSEKLKKVEAAALQHEIQTVENAENRRVSPAESDAMKQRLGLGQNQTYSDLRWNLQQLHNRFTGVSGSRLAEPKNATPKAGQAAAETRGEENAFKILKVTPPSR